MVFLRSKINERDDKIVTSQSKTRTSTLTQVTYTDSGLKLCCYADTIVYKQNKDRCILAAIRFGGYPEHVKALSDVIGGGATIEADFETETCKLDTLKQRYVKQITQGEIYAEATIYIADKEEDEQSSGDEKQTKIDIPKRAAYIFCESKDKDGLFEEIDKRVSVPLIPEFADYLISELQRKEYLNKLIVKSDTQQFEAWELLCTQNDKNIIKAVEEGLKSGKISIPNSKTNDEKVFEQVNTVSQYLKEFGVTIAERIKSRFVPLFDPAVEQLSDEILSVNANIQKNTGYSLYDAQLAVAESVKRKLDKYEPAMIVAECGSGKTKIGTTALYASQLAKGKAKAFNVVMCPSHITKKWVREIEETVPNAVGGVIKSINELKKFYREYQKKSNNKTFFAVISKEKARDGYMHRPAVTWNNAKRGLCCPSCGKVIEEELCDDGCRYRVTASTDFFRKENRKNHKCEYCGNVLWTSLEAHEQTQWVKISDWGFVNRRFPMTAIHLTRSEKVKEQMTELAKYPNENYTAAGAHRRFPLSTYIKKKMGNKIDGFIADELHQYSKDSGQGEAMAEIADVAKQFVGMTATLINGYASGIFYLLYRIVPNLMQLDGQSYTAPLQFCREYGVVESVFEVENEYNSNRRSVKKNIRERMLPGVSPLVYSRFLLENCVFLSLSDMGKDLPEYEEIPISLSMSSEVQSEYERLEREFREIMRKDRKIAKKILSSYLNLLTVYPDQPYGHKPVVDPFTGEPLVTARDLSSFDEAVTNVYAQKDLEVLSLVDQKLSAGENVLVYTSWIRIDTQQKLLKLLNERGYTSAVLSASVSPEKREAWLEKQVKSGTRVVICNPTVVETGLDLNYFTTLIYYNVGYNLFTLRQSSRRSWRINQTAPRIEVYMFYYSGTMQNRAMKLMASKLAAATIIEGCITDEGLAAMSDCRDMTSQLAKELTLGIQCEVEDISEVFKKMAVLKPDIEITQASTATAEPVSVPVVQNPLKQVQQKPQVTADSQTFIFAPVSKSRKKTVDIENQISLFDLVG